MISRGLGGQSPLVKITVNFGGWDSDPPKNSCIGLAFQSVLTMLLKCFALV